MKRSIFFILLVSMIANAQHVTDQFQVIRIGTSPKVDVTEADEYNSSNLSIAFDWVNKFSSGNEVGITAEYVDLKVYYFTFGLQANFPILFKDVDGFETLFGVEGLVLQREREGMPKTRDEKGDLVPNTWFSLKAKAISRYNFSDLIDVSFICAIQTRQDVNTIWGGEIYSVAGYLKIGFKFK